MNLEQIGTSAIEALFARTDLLVADINKNDKIPSWDGDIFVYKSPKKTKDLLYGKVPVQIKCQNDTRKSVQTMYWKYPVELSDLRNYLQDGGVIFFVVKTDGSKEIVYYNALLPADLLNEISRFGNQKQHRLQFKKAPANPVELQNIFFDFIRHKDYQSSLKNIGFKSPEELIKSGYTEMFFESRTINPFDLVGQEVYQYAKNPIGSVVCVNKVGIRGLAISKHDGIISVNNKNFFKGYEVQKTANLLEIWFASKNIHITFKNNTPKSFSMLLGGTLRDHINCLEFAIEANAHNGFAIDGIEFQFGKAEPNSIKREDANKTFSNNLFVLRKIESLFETLGLRDDVQLPENIINKLFFIAGSVLDNKYVVIEDMNPYGIFRTPLNDKYLILRAYNVDEKHYMIRDMFSKPIGCITRQPEAGFTTACNHSYFLLLNERDFYDAINLDLHFVHQDVLSYLNEEHLEETASFILMHYWFKLVKAFDKTQQTIFIELARETLDKLKQEYHSRDNFWNSLFLNDMQLIKRQRTLTQEEVNLLDELISSSKISEHRVAAYLLKDDFDNAVKEFNTLSQHEQERFKTYPMFKFWKK